MSAVEKRCVGPHPPSDDPLVSVWIERFKRSFYVCERCLAAVGTPMVYFFRAGDLVKIGYSRRDVQARLRACQTGSPVSLTLWHTVPGGPDVERELHQRFAADRQHGEWFRISDAIREFVGAA